MSEKNKIYLVVEANINSDFTPTIQNAGVTIMDKSVTSAKIVDSSKLRPVIQYERRSLAYGTG